MKFKHETSAPHRSWPIECYDRPNQRSAAAALSPLVHIPSVDIQQRNNINILGEGPATMVLAHGFGCNQSMWRYLVPAFREYYRIVLFDLVGSGASDLGAYDQQKYGSLAGYAADLLEIIDYCGGGPVIYVGHSVSAMIGLLASIAAPARFAANVMVAPSACYIDDDGYRGGFSHADIDDLLDTLDSNYLGWSSAMAPAIMGALTSPSLGRSLRTAFAVLIRRSLNILHVSPFYPTTVPICPGQPCRP